MTGSTEGSGRRIFGNTLAVGGSRAVNMLLALVLTPVLVRQLGVDEYGVYILATTLTFTSGFLSIGELGIQQSAVRTLAVQRRDADWTGVASTGSSAIAIFTAIGLAAGALIALMAAPLTALFEIGPQLRDTARVTFALTGVQVVLEFVSVGVRCTHEGAQRLGLGWSADVVGRTCWALLAGALVLSGGGAASVVAAGIVGSAVSAVLSVVFLRRIPGQPRLAVGAVRRNVVVDLVRGATGFFGIRLVGLVHSQIDRLVLGLLVGSAAVGIYEIAYKVYAVAAAMLGILPAAVVPATAFRSVDEAAGSLRTLFLRGTSYAVGLTTTVVVCLLVYADDLLRVWLGSDQVSLAAITRLFLVYPLLAMVTVIGQAMLLGLNRVRPLLDLHVVALVVNVVVTVFLASRMGAAGAVWGTVTGAVISTPPVVVLLCRQLDVGAAAFLRTLWPAAVTAFFQLAVAFLLVVLGFEHPGVLGTALQVGLCGTSGLVAFVLVAVPREEREALIRSFPWSSPRTPRDGSVPDGPGGR